MMFLVTLTLLINGAMASEQLAYCEQQFANNGKTEQESSCLDLVVTEAKGKLSLTNGLTQVAATSNAIVFKDEKKSEILAGDQTQLQYPKALNWDQDNSELYVLLASGDINIYTDFVLGNVAPKRIIKNLELPGAHDLSVGKTKVAVLNDDTHRILLLNREANSRAQENVRKDQVLKTIELPDSLSFNVVAYEEAVNSDTFYLVTISGDFYTVDSSGVIKSMNHSIKNSKVVGLSFDAKKRALLVRTLNGNQELSLP